jgi:hypothetical protein
VVRSEARFGRFQGALADNSSARADNLGAPADFSSASGDNSGRAALFHKNLATMAEDRLPPQLAASPIYNFHKALQPIIDIRTPTNLDNEIFEHQYTHGS